MEENIFRIWPKGGDLIGFGNQFISWRFADFLHIPPEIAASHIVRYLHGAERFPRFLHCCPSPFSLLPSLQNYRIPGKRGGGGRCYSQIMASQKYLIFLKQRSRKHTFYDVLHVLFCPGFRSRSRPEPGYLAGAVPVTLAQLRLRLRHENYM